VPPIFLVAETQVHFTVNFPWRRMSRDDAPTITLQVPGMMAQSFFGVQQESVRPSAAKNCFDATQLATVSSIPRPETTVGFRGRAVITAQAPSAKATLMTPRNAVDPGWICCSHPVT